MKVQMALLVPVAVAAGLVSCGRDPIRITLSPTGAATGRVGVTLSIRGSGFLPGNVIRFGRREIATHLDAQGALVGALDRSDLDMNAAHPEEMLVDVVVLDGNGGAVVSTVAPFAVRKAFHFRPASRIASLGSSVANTRLASIGKRSLALSWWIDGDLHGMTSDDDGSTWSAPALLRSSVGYSTECALEWTKSGRALLVVNRAGQLLVTASNDRCVTWRPETEVTGAMSVDTFGTYVEPSGRIHVAWTQPQGGSWVKSVFTSRSSDDGLTWSPAEFVAESQDNVSSAEVVSDGSERVMIGYEYYYGRYPYWRYFRPDSSGRAWEAVSDPDTAGLSTSVIASDGALVVCGSRMYLPYMYRATMARSTSWGGTWEKDRLGDAYGSCRSITTDGSKRTNAVVEREPNYAVLRSLDQGTSWGSESIIGDSQRADNPPLSAVSSDGTLLVVWIPGAEIYAARGE